MKKIITNVQVRSNLEQTEEAEQTKQDPDPFLKVMEDWESFLAAIS